MKTLIVLLAAGLISTSSFSQQISVSTTDASYSTFEKLFCGNVSGDWAEVECALSSTTAGGATISSLTLGGVVALKEEIQNVEADAYNFIAGESITLALEEVIEKVRHTGPEFNEASDKEIVAFMLKTI